MGVGAAAVALAEADLVAVMLRRVAALAMRRATGLEAPRDLAPLFMAVLRVRVRRVWGADVGVAGAGVAAGKVPSRGRLSTRAAVLTSGTSVVRTGAARALALAVALALLVVVLLRDELALDLEELELTAAELLLDLAAEELRLVRGLAAALVVVDLLRLGLVRPFGLSASPRPFRVR